MPPDWQARFIEIEDHMLHAEVELREVRQQHQSVQLGVEPQQLC